MPSDRADLGCFSHQLHLFRSFSHWPRLLFLLCLDGCQLGQAPHDWVGIIAGSHLLLPEKMPIPIPAFGLPRSLMHVLEGTLLYGREPCLAVV